MKARQRQTEKQIKNRKDKLNKADPLMEEELGAWRKGVNRGFLKEKLVELKHDSVPGLGCPRNKYLHAILLAAFQ